MLQLRVMAAVADLIGSLPGLAAELVRAGVLRELLRLLRHPVVEHRNNGCNDSMAKAHIIYEMEMVDVLRECAKQLPQVLPLACLGGCPALHEVSITLLNQGGRLSRVKYTCSQWLWGPLPRQNKIASKHLHWLLSWFCSKLDHLQVGARSKISGFPGRPQPAA